MLHGQVDLSAIAQDAQEATAFGEEVGDFLSMDFEMGINSQEVFFDKSNLAGILFGRQDCRQASGGNPTAQ